MRPAADPEILGSPRLGRQRGRHRLALLSTPTDGGRILSRSVVRRLSETPVVHARERFVGFADRLGDERRRRAGRGAFVASVSCIRDCQPLPVARYAASTSGSIRRLTIRLVGAFCFPRDRFKRRARPGASKSPGFPEPPETGGRLRERSRSQNVRHFKGQDLTHKWAGEWGAAETPLDAECAGCTSVAPTRQKLVRPARIELAAPRLGGGCSIP